MLISVKPAFGSQFGRFLLHMPLRAGLEVVPDRCRVEGGADSQRAPEGPASEGLVKAVDGRVQPCATTRQTTSQIRYKQGLALFIPHRDHSQERRPAIPPATPDTGPDRARNAVIGP